MKVTLSAQARIGLAIGLLIVSPATLLAQTFDDPPTARLEVGPYVGVARHSLVGTHLGVTPDRDHLFLGVHAALNVVRRPRWTLGYAPEVVPLLLVSNNPKYRRFPDGAGGQIVIEDGRGPVAGFAISPLGVEAQVRLGARWRGYTAGAAGLVWFTREVPVAYARAFNYAFEVGGGVLWRYSPRQSLRLGYKFHHLSNGFTAPQNPGIDGAVFLVGIQRAIG
jgi:lipid A 3-O-deacylase PagL